MNTYTLPPEHPAWIEYDHAAEDTARRGLKGNDGDPLPANMTPEAVLLIAADTDAFRERVRIMAYALAMIAMEQDQREEYEEYVRRCGGAPISAIRP